MAMVIGMRQFLGALFPTVFVVPHHANATVIGTRTVSGLPSHGGRVCGDLGGVFSGRPGERPAATKHCAPATTNMSVDVAATQRQGPGIKRRVTPATANMSADVAAIPSRNA
jgi:hypothetical protein